MVRFRRTQTVVCAILTILVAVQPLTASAQTATNSTCTVGSSGTIRNCADVPTGGIAYTSGVTQVSVSDPSPTDRSQVVVNGGTVGILLTDIGGSGSTGVSSSAIEKILNPGPDGTAGNADDYYELGDGSGNFVLDDNGNRIRVVTDSSGKDILTDAGGTPLALADLDNYLASISGGGSGVAVGDVTIVNAANFQTSGAAGITGTATGGNGGKGGTVNILFIGEVGKDGGDGKNGGSVAITSDGVITVSGTDAYGIVATSQGGNGGEGGGIGALISKAGAGGDGGDGGQVQVDVGSFSVITTTGTGGHGVFAQSLGGDGGKGGNTGGAVALGSKGGDGGAGSSVTVNHDGTIATSGDYAYGIYARSYGAGAGSGSSTGGIVAIGGNGGGFASGGAVTVTNTGAIETGGLGSYGIIAQSVGGGGGDGGGSGGLFTIGGKAGSGGHGGAVTLTQTSTGSVVTSSDGAIGIIAQSIGGGGGNGGNAVSVSPNVAISLGGDGGPGGNGGTASVDVSGVVQTGGGDAYAVVAQSIGGGGGSGGLAASGSFSTGLPSVSVAIGGTGGSGGSGGIVNLTSNAVISTTGDRSGGLMAQSIGGGGGNGGAAIAANVAAGASASISVAAGGGIGGTAGNVTVDAQTGSIVTLGTSSYGIIAQSVGGGGGSGGLAVSGSISAGNIGVALGGDGAAGGAGGETRVTNAVTIDTGGAGAYGIFAQSVGGGGGEGGMAISGGLSASVSVNVGLGGDGGSGGTSDLVSIDNTGAITTRNGSAYGILAQSLGGAGGAGGNTITASGAGGIVAGSVAIGLGGDGATGGTSGAVTVSNTKLDPSSTAANITTLGAGSTALIAQSIGGAGGAGGYAVAATLTISKDGGGAVSVALGGDGGIGGTAGAVTVTSSGTLATQGDASSGIIAQSIGGAGGVGGTAVAGSINVSKGAGLSVAVGQGGTGASGGIAKLVTVTNDGQISTLGADAFGILAQSIGGAGGAGGMSIAGALNATGNAGGSVAVSLGGAGGSGGTAGAVVVTNNGAITTVGARSGGVVAQSIGGEGGTGGLSVGAALSGSLQSQTGSVAVSLGGSGGTGGTASTVTLINTGNISTSGDSNETADGERVNTDAHALLAQSIGGSGGLGGFGGAAALAAGKQQTASVSVAIGGGGGTGGQAGVVNVSNTAALSTGSDNSIGIVAQSIGGGGGAGGGSVSLSFAFSQQSNSGSVGVSIGGGGGAGARADAVHVDNTGTISTLGDSAYGILAQSIGGDGGQGGFTVAATGTVSREVSGAVGVAVGGPGGVGGTAGTVTVGYGEAIDGLISTSGENAAGIVAQSIGGGGGAGGFAGSLTGVVNQGKDKRTLAIGVTVGGFGGSGGAADTVTVNTASTAVIGTKGDYAYGILAQSIGGKGGTGGGALGTVINVATGGNSSLNAALTVGGFGGAGAVAGDVIVNNDGTIITGDPSLPFGGQYAHGILAQSIGGDGGAGGFSGSIAFAVGASNQSSNNYNLSASVGGFGGTGANADAVTVTNGGTIVVYGERARGIFAQSVGGGGGAGGDTGLGDDVWGENFLLDTAATKIFNGDFESLDLGAGGAYAGGYGANSHSLAASVGGFGGAGGDGSTVTVTNTGAIYTFGTKGHGIFAQSVGGGGGQGGISTAATAAIAASNSTSVSLAVGGFGGAAGDGGSVEVKNNGQIVTVYHGAFGVFAQSVGGGGGAGGDTRGFTLQRKDTTLEKKTLKPGKQLTVTVGGFGGAGGDGGTVDVTNAGAITTFGTGSVGIFAQSIGGGGGTGGNSSVSNKELAALFENDETVKKQFRSQKYKLALGGFGGSGGIGETVTVTNSGTIVTEGEQATGIYAQSVGGGGGTGGKASTGFSGDLSVGGFGGTGNDGGLVIVSNTGAITTMGNLADGIFVQSVGGGGGDGGAADFGDARSFRGELIKAIRKKGFKEGIKDLAKKIFLPTFGVGVGGFGGAAGDGGDVYVCNGATYDATSGACSGSVATSSIVTVGNASHGIFAQSVGGGGGTGGQAYLTNVGKIGIGGLGGAAGDGGAVTVVNNGNITTYGNGSYGVFAQSVGGGGGLAGDITFGIEGLGRDEAKLARNFVEYATSADVPGIDLDGDGTVSAAEKTATQNLFGFSSGGGTASSESTDIDQNGLPISDELAAQFAALYGGSNVGTDPLSYSPSDPLNGQSTSSIQSAVLSGLTSALQQAGVDMKAAIVSGLQSAFPSLSGQIANLSGSQVVEFLKKAFTTDGTSITLNTGEVFDFLNGITGDGGAVRVVTTGNITVTGGASSDPDERAGSIGIFAQSVGGGGGIVGNTVSITEAEIDTDLNLDGDKDDTFDVSDGTAFAGTVGGKGKGGTVYVKHTGGISATSWNGYGIFAQSTGGDGGSNITIEVDGGTIEGGENLGAAILIDGGQDNTLDIGSDSNISAVSERALIGGEGNEAVTSAGTVVGNVDLGAGTNSYLNKTAGLLETRTTINLNGGAFTNQGTVDLAGFGTVGTTALTGSYTQTTGGYYAVDLNFGTDASDLMQVSGAASLGGTVLPNLITLARIAPPETVLTAAGGLTDNGIDVRDTPIVDYGVLFDGNDFKITINSVDFSLDGATRNQAAAGDFINRILNGDGSAALGTFFANVANLTDVSQINGILQRIHPEFYSAQLASTLQSAQRFPDLVHNCPASGDVNAIVAGDQCVWGRASGRYYSNGSSFDFSKVGVRSYSLETGIQGALAPNWTLGGAVAYEQIWTEVGAIGAGTGERANGGLGLKYHTGDWELFGAASGGYGWYDAGRNLNLTAFEPEADRATANYNIAHASLTMGTAYAFRNGAFYLKPGVEANATYLKLLDFDEHGAGPLNLQFRDNGQWYFSGTASIEFGARFVNPTSGTIFRPFVKGGITAFSDDHLSAYAKFEGAPDSAGTFRAVSDLDRVVGTINAGIDITAPDSTFSVRLGYEGAFGENTETHGGSVRFGLKF